MFTVGPSAPRRGRRSPRRRRGRQHPSPTATTRSTAPRGRRLRRRPARRPRRGSTRSSNVEDARALVQPTPTRRASCGRRNEVPSFFALESAMDELASKLGMDPVELRRATTRRRTRSPACRSARARWCSASGGARELSAGPSATPRPGPMREGDGLVGFGCATATYPTHIAASAGARPARRATARRASRSAAQTSAPAPTRSSASGGRGARPARRAGRASSWATARCRPGPSPAARIRPVPSALRDRRPARASATSGSSRAATDGRRRALRGRARRAGRRLSRPRRPDPPPRPSRTRWSSSTSTRRTCSGR